MRGRVFNNPHSEKDRKREALNMLWSGSEIADLLSLTPRRVSYMVEEGTLIPKAHSQGSQKTRFFDPREAIRAYTEFRVEAARREERRSLETYEKHIKALRSALIHALEERGKEIRARINAEAKSAQLQRKLRAATYPELKSTIHSIESY